jgi:hypothetical protein
MPREDQPVVRSSVEGRRIWANVYSSDQVDEHFHPVEQRPSPPASARRPPPLPFQIQNKPWNPSATREVERRVFREALQEVDDNRDKELGRLQVELYKAERQRDLLLRTNTVLAKCMEKMSV